MLRFVFGIAWNCMASSMFGIIHRVKNLKLVFLSQPKSFSIATEAKPTWNLTPHPDVVGGKLDFHGQVEIKLNCYRNVSFFGRSIFFLIGQYQSIIIDVIDFDENRNFRKMALTWYTLTHCIRCFSIKKVG